MEGEADGGRGYHSSQVCRATGEGVRAREGMEEEEGEEGRGSGKGGEMRVGGQETKPRWVTGQSSNGMRSGERGR